jgi:hypothetical protein
MSDLTLITDEIDKILSESYKPVVTAPEESDLPSIEETVVAVAGVLMEEFPEGGDSSLFARGLIESANSCAEDTGLDRHEVFEGLIQYFSDALEEAVGMTHLLSEDAQDNEDFDEYDTDIDDDDDDIDGEEIPED